MARDIEEFLRKAAERRAAQQKQQQQAPPQRPPQPPRQEIRPPAQRLQPVQPVVIQPQQDALVEIDEIEIVEPSSQSVAEHVATHLDTREIAEHARKLGKEVSRTQNKIDAQIQRKFDHEIGKLADDKTTTQKKQQPKKRQKAESPAESIFRQMRSPRSVGQAILLAELLKRPDFD